MRIDTDPFDSFRARLSGNELVKNVLMLGSAPAAPSVAELLSDDTIVVALNNAHRAVARTDFSVYAGDFPQHLKHPRVSVIGRSVPNYLPAVSEFGGMMYCAATIAFAAAYWAIRNFPFAQISFFACDMTYEGEGTSHFYGQGSPDPLRKNITLQNLPASSLRIFYFGILNDVLFLNASAEEKTVLLFPRDATGQILRHTIFADVYDMIRELKQRLAELAKPALELEASTLIDPHRADYWFYNSSPEAWDHMKRVSEKWLGLNDEVRSFERQFQSRLASATAPR